MKLIVGLGNPGKEYENTRHNAGASFVDFLVKKMNLNFVEKFRSLYVDTQINGEKIIFIKPQTFMNDSGSAVVETAKFFKILPENIFIAFDDLDIIEGEWKLQLGKYPKIHNGVNDIIQKLGTDKVNFIRIGIDGRSPVERDFIQGRDYVLAKSKFDYVKIFDEISKTLNLN
jgi:peptidyl-tRNA hydrolase, PTH1 family